MSTETATQYVVQTPDRVIAFTGTATECGEYTAANTGSFTVRPLSERNNAIPVTPEVGMGATDRAGSDAYPYTIIEVSASGKRIWVQADKYTRTDDNGLSESQTYTYEADPNGVLRQYSLRKDGGWHPVGSPMEWWNRLHVGSRRAYRDPSR